MSKIYSEIKPVQYEITDLLKVPLKRRFYRQELTKAPAPKDTDYFQVEKILKERKVKGKKEYFVKFLYYPSKFCIWIPEGNLIKVRNECISVSKCKIDTVSFRLILVFASSCLQ